MPDVSTERWEMWEIGRAPIGYWDIFTESGALVARLLCDDSERVAREIVASHNERLEQGNG